LVKIRREKRICEEEDGGRRMIDEEAGDWFKNVQKMNNVLFLVKVVAG